ncbi:MAG: dihydroorotate dehydrogenase [Phycisphaerales bacterium]|nr:dihydroorotate dehydrogenase [Phycisphaerales bacterium]
MRVRIGRLELRNPLLTASGTCGYGPEYAGVLDYSRLGGFTTKSVTRLPRPGNPPCRTAEVSGGMLNAIGLANVGLQRFLAEKLPFIRTMPTPVFANVAGYSIDDYVHVAGALDAAGGLAGIELNVSCPNVAQGLMFGTDAALLGEVVRAVRGVVRSGLLIVKLSPNVTDIAPLAAAAVDAGADALSAINTYVGLAIDGESRRPLLGNVTGGLSGPAIKPLALFNVHRAYREVAKAAGVPIIGMGGVRSAADVIEFLLAGATAVAVGTALFLDPTLPLRVCEGVTAYLDRHGAANVAELTGALRLT